MEIFTSLKNQEPLFMFLNGVIATSEDPEVHFK